MQKQKSKRVLIDFQVYVVVCVAKECWTSSKLKPRGRLQKSCTRSANASGLFRLQFLSMQGGLLDVYLYDVTSQLHGKLFESSISTKQGLICNNAKLRILASDMQFWIPSTRGKALC